MRSLRLAVSFIVIGLLAGPAVGQEKEKKKPQRLSRQELRKKYDKDGDGRLNEAERAALRKDIAAGVIARPERPRDRRRDDQRRRGPRVPDGVKVERDVVYGRAGERELRLDVYLPEKRSDEALPAVVWIHGGGWRGGNKSSGAGRVAPLAATGDYVGFSVGYRLSGEAKFPAQIHDCKAAIRYIRASAKKYGVDPARIGVWGSSAGGHLVSLLGTSGDVEDLEGTNGSPGVSSRVSCVVDYCGPSNFLAFHRDNPRETNRGGAVNLLLGGTPEERKDAAIAASPVTYVSKDDPPFLIVHGTNDRTVPFEQAEELYGKLREAGVDATFVKMDGGGHGIGGPEITRRVRAFFEKHLRGRDVQVSREPIKVAGERKRPDQRRKRDRKRDDDAES